jgi:hypothetical protein
MVRKGSVDHDDGMLFSLICRSNEPFLAKLLEALHVFNGLLLNFLLTTKTMPIGASSISGSTV